MKKVLFATTALVASAGFAAAQGVEISGAAEMGYAGGNGAEGFLASADVRFSMSGTTDNGLTFGAIIDLEDATETSNNVDVVDTATDFTVFIGGAFGNLTLGDTDGAMDWAITEAVGGAGSLNDAETGHDGYLGGNALDGAQNSQILRYDNTFGDFGFAVSVDGDDEMGLDTGWGVGVTYDVAFAGGSVALGAAYQYTEVSTAAAGAATPYNIGDTAIAALTDIDAWAVSAAVVLDSGFSAGVAYTDVETSANIDIEHYQLSAGYAFGPMAIGVNYGEFDGDSTDSGYGISASYDLGGGASAHLGYGFSDNAVGVDTDSYSFGIAMSF